MNGFDVRKSKILDISSIVLIVQVAEFDGVIPSLRAFRSQQYFRFIQNITVGIMFTTDKTSD